MLNADILLRIQRSKLNKSHPDLISEIDLGKLDNILIENLHKSSKVKISWRCSSCSHEWLATPASRALGGTGCPPCARKIKALKSSSIKKLNKKHGLLSLEYPNLFKEIDLVGNDIQKVANTTSGSGRSILWKCQDCGHKWSAAVYSRVLKGRGCPICARTKRGNHNLDGSSDLPIELKNSFIRSIKPLNVKFEKLTQGSDVIALWRCNNNHEYIARVRNHINNMNQCSICHEVGSSNQEREILTAITEALCIPYQKAPYKVAGFRYPVDFLSEAHNLVIQFDSEYYHEKPEKLLSDKKNTETLAKLGYKVIRLREGNLPKISQSDFKLEKNAKISDYIENLTSHIAREIK